MNTINEALRALNRLNEAVDETEDEEDWSDDELEYQISQDDVALKINKIKNKVLNTDWGELGDQVDQFAPQITEEFYCFIEENNFSKIYRLMRQLYNYDGTTEYKKLFNQTCKKLPNMIKNFIQELKNTLYDQSKRNTFRNKVYLRYKKTEDYNSRRNQLKTRYDITPEMIYAEMVYFWKAKCWTVGEWMADEDPRILFDDDQRQCLVDIFDESLIDVL